MGQSSKPPEAHKLTKPIRHQLPELIIHQHGSSKPPEAHKLTKPIRHQLTKLIIHQDGSSKTPGSSSVSMRASVNTRMCSPRPSGAQ